MNKNKLKTYAPQARRDFIAAVTQRAHLLGITAKDISPNRRQGDVVIIDGREWPAKIGEQRQRLIKRIERDGFEQTMEAVAYTWFNRIAALRYMELHDYLGHGYRVLSNRDGGPPEILSHALDVDLPGLDRDIVTELKLAGSRDGELYRMLLVAQCNALSAAMPFLFERIDDETELLLPDNLLRTDSVITKLVDAIPEEDWREVEIIGWLYQFYISEKKDQVIGKVVKSEDIPAATQLFTPNWIVKYLVQNSIGRLWLMANPASTLKEHMAYYIEPAEQTPEVRAQLDVLIQTRMAEDGGSLNPETITVLDPACGSGHILVEAYDLLKQIYLERGYQLRSIPRLILEKNLYGLDIDERAAQMAGFALLMKARADDRHLLNDPLRLNVLALQESHGLDGERIIKSLVGGGARSKPATPNPFAEVDLFPETRKQRFLGEDADEDEPARSPFDIERASLIALLRTFTQAKTFGSLIQVPESLGAALPTLAEGLKQASESGDVFAQAAAVELMPLVWQASILSMKFDAVIANPPYMGGKGMNPALKDFAKKQFPDAKSDLFAMFVERGLGWCKAFGFNNMVTMQSWIFLSSFENMRKRLLHTKTIHSLVQIGYNSFPEINSKIAQACAFSIGNVHIEKYKSSFINLNSAHQSADKSFVFINRNNSIIFFRYQSDFQSIPGSPIAYWIRNYNIFSTEKLSKICTSGGRTKSHNDALYIRNWWELKSNDIGQRWVWFEKGGDFRKWYGNKSHVIDWSPKALAFYEECGGLCNRKLWWKEGVTWPDITSAHNGFRYKGANSQYGSVSPTLIFEDRKNLNLVLGLLNSRASTHFSKVLNPTIHLNVGDVLNFPLPKDYPEVEKTVADAVELARKDWNSFETSSDFQRFLWLAQSEIQELSATLSSSWQAWQTHSRTQIQLMQELETENNRLFIEAYGLQDELSPEVAEDQITLARADREKDCQRLISYAIGCMMGRYSLEEPGLVYAHGGNVGFDPTRYKTFPADADGIVPLTDELWFEDDAASRIREFLLAVWGREMSDENMAWLAESLGKKGSETPDETIRRYLSASFFKDHLQTYKKRPIYWLFSSGKQKAFEALVYLHRYHEGTLARMRSEYVVPLTAKMLVRIDMLQKDADAASSASTRNKISKQIETLKKKHLELLAFDEKLRHYADMRIALDLDDGVKVNYGKFGDLLAEVKAVTGGAGDD
ncbi:BREX-1 system adenine-specific DNA-methyltransferase PglX [Methylocaldum sp. RMAD-M]|jgi:hypothetical protein|uniref:BREX-1 system adenine-specific DNA-methyltransferase PglX n=1 Tax=Methylocaldum sp. RMAD-M TaxID=2806557 RepID=UPI001AEA8760|nr:BREX-1 system adenine-specific DNA-methyltransferase PglX [Methylocaldum sp. RMAD-M]MBP1152767.1 hypothetical protein [Methylocaldum sp. RMAD-M]